MYPDNLLSNVTMTRPNYGQEEEISGSSGNPQVPPPPPVNLEQLMRDMQHAYQAMLETFGATLETRLLGRVDEHLEAHHRLHFPITPHSTVRDASNQGSGFNSFTRSGTVPQESDGNVIFQAPADMYGYGHTNQRPIPPQGDVRDLRQSSHQVH